MNAGGGPDVLPLGLAGRILLRNWLLLLIGLILGAAGGILAARNTAPTYSATATQLVKGIPGTGVAANYEAAQFAVSRARSYPSFIYSQGVLEGVARDMGDATINDARLSLVATNPTDTPLVQITATGRSAAEARDRANSAARHMATFITDIETVSGKTPISVETAVQALLPQDPSDPRPSIYAAIGSSIGLVLAIVLAVAGFFASRGRGISRWLVPGNRFRRGVVANDAPARALIARSQVSPDADAMAGDPEAGTPVPASQSGTTGHVDGSPAQGRTGRRRGSSRPVHGRV